MGNKASINSPSKPPPTLAPVPPASETTPLVSRPDESSQNSQSVDTFRSTVSHGGGDDDYNSSNDNSSIPSSPPLTNYTKFSLSAESFHESFHEVMFQMKRIGFWGSMSIAVNSLTGPAMLNLPDTYQRSGVIPTTVAILFVCFLSALCCLHMSNTISKVPGNENFTMDIGFSECFRHFWGPKSYVYTQLLFYCCILCLNVSSIVDTAQVIDTILGHWLENGSGAINFILDDSSLRIQWVNWDYSLCSQEMLVTGECVPFFDQEGILFTAGYALMLLFFLPMALMDLKENTAMQVCGFLVLLFASIGFVVLFAMQGVDFDNVTMWGTEWGSLFGVILFNFALVIAVPAWLYEKEEHVSVPAVVHSSSILSAVLYIFIGILGAVTMPVVSPNMLESLMSGAFGAPLQLCASIFAFFILGLGCPLFSVLTRMNLTCNDLVSHRNANILAVYVPFLSSWLFYQGNAITQLLSWGGIAFTSLIAFILPLMIALFALDMGDVSSLRGSIDVYYPLHFFKSKRAQRWALQALLVISSLSIVAAILGNVFNDDIMEMASSLTAHKQV